MQPDRSTSPRPRSLYGDLASALAVLMVVASVLGTLLVYRYFTHQAELAYQSKTSEYSAYLRDSLELPLWNLDDELIQKIGIAFAANSEISALVIRDDEQRVVYRQEKTDERQNRQKIVILHRGQAIGSVEIGLTRRVNEEHGRQLMLASVATTLLLIVVLIAATRWILSRMLKKPIESVIAATDDMVAGKYHAIDLPETYREFANILTGFKTMSDAVASREESLYQSNKQLAAEIAERKHAEEALRVSEERLHLATNAGSIGIWDWDVVNNHLLWDESMYILYGIRKDDFGGAYDAWTRTLHPEDRAYAEGEIQAALRGEREYAPEFRIVRPDGTIRNIKASSKTFYDDEGKPIRMIGTNYDLTSMRKAEEELRKYKDHLEDEVEQRTTDLVLARNAAEAANNAKSVFLANMSHELRTPLNAILGFSSLMRNDPDLSQSHRENLDIINRSGEHLLTLINDVLEMSKIEAGRVQLNNEAFNVGNMVRDVMDMMEIRSREKGLRLILDQSSQFPSYIKADEARLRQILINLVGNAVKFTQQGGVTVRLGVLAPLKDKLLIEVEDTGPGISIEEQQHLFQPFVQLGKPDAQKGTGLGLAITRQYAQLMGGTVGVNSTPGVGSTFRVELPFEKVDQVEIVIPQTVDAGEVVGLAPGQPDYRVLIVEDQLENRMLLVQLMQHLGIACKTAENGEEAVRLFEAWRPQLIWMDRRMPVMDGIEATRKIRALPDGGKVKIVAVTASVFTEQREEMLQAGMDDFVRKPYRFSEIYACLARQLGVRYLYEQGKGAEHETLGETLAPKRFMILPNELRQSLRQALESLDTERIDAVIEEVGHYDLRLQKTLSTFAGNFDYPAILRPLQQADG
ncbi:ATPase [Novimethylophilus kurashikiensis]|uniref:Virulence sensor protein BvgS n=1 Tax=Novimethylophilus kurashikiensis TaxID=1825523 RepID=A0A2R5FA80_9PROT|nr:ATP-binding protein [Novimethylophilus kurashikiensis]GBG14729.1 ATPase [Novimethylophilus kurashikiensis]